MAGPSGRRSAELLFEYYAQVTKRKDWASLLFIVCSEMQRPRQMHPVFMKLMSECISASLKEESSWPHVVPALNTWLSSMMEQRVTDLIKRLKLMSRNESWPVSKVSRAKRWCVDNGHANVVLLLGLVTEDLGLVETAVTLSSLDVSELFLLRVATKLAKSEERGGSFSAAAALLDVCPLTVENMEHRYFYALSGNGGLTRECERRELWALALVLQHHKRGYVQRHFSLCDSPTVINFVLEKTVFRASFPYSSYQLWWSLVQDLVPSCKDKKTLLYALQTAVRADQTEVVEVLLSHMDPSSFYFVDGEGNVNTLLSEALGNSKVGGNTLRVLLASGLSAVQRDMDSICPLKQCLEEKRRDFLHYNLECGSFSNRTLYAVANDKSVKQKMESDEEMKKCFKRVEEAAKTPSRLEHLARLAVSRRIGCQPGRSDRIDTLGLPTVLGENVKFRHELYPNIKTLRRSKRLKSKRLRK